MRMHGIQTIVITLVCILLLAVVSCATPKSPVSTTTATITPVAAKTLTFGIIAPLTGAVASIGQDIGRGHEMVAEEVNARGGLKVGNDRYLIELKPYDDKYAAPEAVAAANKLIFEDGAKFITVMGSTSALAVQPISEPNEVWTVNAAFAKGAIAADKPLSFRTRYTALESAEGMYVYITTKMSQIKTVAIIAFDDETGKAGLQQSTKVINSIGEGLTIVDTELVPRALTDYYPIITKILSYNPDMIDTTSFTASDLGLLVKQLKERGYKGQIINLTSLDVNALIKVAGSENAEGILSSESDVTGPASTIEERQMVDAYTKKYALPFGTLGSFYYFLPAMVAGVEAAQSVDPVKVSQVLPTITFKSLGNTLSWGGAQRYGIKHHLVQPVWVSIVKDGKLVGIEKNTPQVP